MNENESERGRERARNCSRASVRFLYFLLIFILRASRRDDEMISSSRMVIPRGDRARVPVAVHLVFSKFLEPPEGRRENRGENFHGKNTRGLYREWRARAFSEEYTPTHIHIIYIHTYIHAHTHEQVDEREREREREVGWQKKCLLNLFRMFRFSRGSSYVLDERAREKGENSVAKNSYT